MRASVCLRTSGSSRDCSPRGFGSASETGLSRAVLVRARLPACYGAASMSQRIRGREAGWSIAAGARPVTRPVRMRLLVAVVALAAIAAKSTDWPSTPGAPGYRLPWNRDTRDTVLDLMPGDLVDRFEFHGRLVDDHGRPLAGMLVYTYHADRTGSYGSKAYPAIPTMAGCVRTGPGGGFVVRSYVPGMYEGPQHMHFEVSLPDRGRCTWFVNFRPDSATRMLPNSTDRGSASAYGEYDEHFALVHLDPDGVYRTKQRALHVRGWFAQPGLDSLHAATARRYERSPWALPKPGPVH